MAKKRLLTWHGPTKRWKKQIDGVVHYFGYGKSQNDTKAYKIAEKKYLEFQDKRQRSKSISISLQETTIGDICEKYLQTLEQRYCRDDLSASHLSKVQSCLKHFLEYLGHRVPFSSVQALILADYRNHVLGLVANGAGRERITGWTAKDRLSQVKALITWAYEMELCEMPRNMRRYTHVELPEPTPKRFSIEEIRTLWAAATPRVRCFMALGLNCGFGQMDISDLRVGEIDFQDAHIDRRRSKTGVRTRHKLWPLTLKLLKELMDPNAEAGDRVFKTTSGKALVRSEWRDGKEKRSDAVKNAFWRRMRQLGMDGGRGFYTLRKTGASEIERINPAVTEMYLAHAERGMRRHYAERNWSALDAALDEMDHVFKLTIE